MADDWLPRHFNTLLNYWVQQGFSVLIGAAYSRRKQFSGVLPSESISKPVACVGQRNNTTGSIVGNAHRRISEGDGSTPPNATKSPVNIENQVIPYEDDVKLAQSTFNNGCLRFQLLHICSFSELLDLDGKELCDISHITQVTQLVLRDSHYSICGYQKSVHSNNDLSHQTISNILLM